MPLAIDGETREQLIEISKKMARQATHTQLVLSHRSVGHMVEARRTAQWLAGAARLLESLAVDGKIIGDWFK